MKSGTGDWGGGRPTGGSMSGCFATSLTVVLAVVGALVAAIAKLA